MATGVKKTMKIPLLDLKKQYRSIKEEIDLAIKNILDSQYFIMGKEILELEKSIASYSDTKYAIGVASGTDALILSLKALGIGDGDEVITVPFTFIATGEAINNTGATPVFVDIDKKSYTMDPSGIEAKITKKTKAILPVHMYGQCADMDSILKIAKTHNLKVVEDCAQAIGATYKTRKAGSLSNAGCISFFPSKNLGAYGDGGMIVTNSEKTAELERLLRVHGSAKRYIHSVLGYNSRLDNLQAAILNVKLKHLDKWSERRREIARFYDEAFKDTKELVTPFTYPYNEHIYHQYTLKVDQGLRDKLIDHLKASGIESRVYYPIPLHMQECYKFLGHKPSDFPVSLDAALSTLVLPVFPELESNELEYIVETVKEFFKKT